MIDEFQDTSVREWENMLPLLQNAMAASDKCSVLIVGDVKQSIYRWRGGDWRLLKDVAQQSLGPGNVELQLLKKNFRSLEKVIDFNNKMITSVVDLDNRYLNEMLDRALGNGDISKELHTSLYNIIDSAYTDHQQTPGKQSDEEGYAELTLYDSTLIDSPFIELIEDAIKRGYRYRDILILVRGANDSRKVADQLFAYKEQRFTSRGEVGFNVHTADALTVENCDVADFIIAIFRLTVNVNDALERGVFNRFLGREYESEFDDNELSFIKRIAHLSPMEAFEQIVMHYNLYERKDRIAYLQAIHEGIYSFSTSRIADIQRYLLWWDERGRNDTLSVDMTDDTIEISTIHKAKGLERDVVIIPYCKWDTTPKASLQPVIWSKAPTGDVASIGEFPVTYGSAMQNSLFTADYYNELVMSHVDGVNLLYVAMTRASKELYMLVPTRLNTKSKTSENINNIVPLLTESVKCVVSDFTPYTGENGVERKVYCYGSKLQRGSSDVVRKSGNNIILQSYTTHTPDIKISTPHRRFLDEGSTLSNDQRRMGQLLHRVFEQATTLEQVGQKVEQMASQSIISDDEAMRIKQAMQQVAANDVVLEWFCGDWDDVKSEADIIDGQSMRRPDRVMIKSKRAVVVDFKFGEVVSNKYVKQVSDYMKLLQRMELYTTIEGYVWYITLGKVVRVEE
jgi:ATP-dependent exoDNAse (exonuclease V) beta subunit